MTYSIIFEPIGNREQCFEKESIMDCARRIGIGISSICGGNGKCKACKIQILKGYASELTAVESETFSDDQLEQGWRLACLTYPLSNCTIQLPVESLTSIQRIQTECAEVLVPLEPAVKTFRVKLTPPNLADLRSDTTRLFQALEQQNIHCDRIDFEVLKTISYQLRDLNWEARVYLKNNEIIGLTPLSARSLGLAIDLGTTKIAGYLIDLTTGKTLSSCGILNPQIRYGEDITTRITYALQSEKAAGVLQDSVILAIDKLAVELCTQTNTSQTEIVDSVIVGNTAMHHLLLKLPVKQLAYSPFIAAIQQSLDIKAGDVGFHFAPGARLHILPNVAGFVGADHISMLLAIDAEEIQETTLAIDIGTNTEVSLINKGKIVAASCASGPAFEGWHIKHGMRAATGAIERLRIINGKISFQTVGNAPPTGICGSGIIDALSQFYLAGLINSSGRINEDSPDVQKTGDRFEIVLNRADSGTPTITLTQNDIREIQLAKAAIRTGIQVLLESVGCVEEEIQNIIVAGAFGTYIDISSAINIGMFPALPLDRYHQIGNAAGLGAKIALLSRSSRLKAQEIASRVKYVELATAPNFRQSFIQAGYLGLYRLRNGTKEVI
jgi:uncharacterized 2Fe-2S/4Fe-4S cluster protein (DUF4445 family)